MTEWWRVLLAAAADGALRELGLIVERKSSDIASDEEATDGKRLCLCARCRAVFGRCAGRCCCRPGERFMLLVLGPLQRGKPF